MVIEFNNSSRDTAPEYVKFRPREKQRLATAADLWIIEYQDSQFSQNKQISNGVRHLDIMFCE